MNKKVVVILTIVLAGLLLAMVAVQLGELYGKFPPAVAVKPITNGVLKENSETIFIIKDGSLVSWNKDSGFKTVVPATGIIKLQPVNRTIYYLRQGDVWQTDLVGKSPVKVTTTDGQVTDFLVSPDGARLVYSAIAVEKGSTGKPIDILNVRYLVLALSLPGAGEKEFNLPLEAAAAKNNSLIMDSWQLDDQTVLFRQESFDGSTVVYWQINVMQGTAQKLNSPVEGSRDLFWSPSRKWLAVEIVEAGKSKLVVLDEGQNQFYETSLSESVGLVSVTWNKDEKSLAASASDFMPGGQTNILIIDLTNKTRKIIEVPGSSSGPASVVQGLYLADNLYYTLAIPGPDKLGTQVWMVELKNLIPSMLADNALTAYVQ